ncbi:MAG: hypothetical protein ACE15C_14490 [Phycisphaerae bacterium]
MTTNKIDRAVAALKTALDALAGSGKTFAQCVARLTNPLKEPEVPIIGVTLDNWRELGGPKDAEQWEGEVLVEVLTRVNGQAAERSITDCVIEVDAAIKAMVAAGSATNGYAYWDMDRWESWHAVQFDPLAPCGAALRLRFRIEGPLKLVT